MDLYICFDFSKDKAEQLCCIKVWINHRHGQTCLYHTVTSLISPPIPKKLTLTLLFSVVLVEKELCYAICQPLSMVCSRIRKGKDFLVSDQLISSNISILNIRRMKIHDTQSDCIWKVELKTGVTTTGCACICINVSLGGLLWKK